MEEEGTAVSLKKSDLDVLTNGGDHHDHADTDSDNSAYESQVNAGDGNICSPNVKETGGSKPKSTAIKLKRRNNTSVVSTSGPNTSIMSTNKTSKDLHGNSGESFSMNAANGWHVESPCDLS